MIASVVLYLDIKTELANVMIIFQIMVKEVLEEIFGKDFQQMAVI